MGMTASFMVLEQIELEEIRKNPNAVVDLLFPKDFDDFEDRPSLYKSWHAIHFLLTNRLEPDGTAVGDAVLGGIPVGPDDLGYGPVRLIEPSRVSEIAEALEGIDIREKYEGLDRNSELLPNIYSGFEFEPEEIGYIENYFALLKAMYKNAASGGNAVLAYLT